MPDLRGREGLGSVLRSGRYVCPDSEGLGSHNELEFFCYSSVTSTIELHVPKHE